MALAQDTRSFDYISRNLLAGGKYCSVTRNGCTSWPSRKIIIFRCCFRYRPKFTYRVRWAFWSTLLPNLVLNLHINLDHEPWSLCARKCWFEGLRKRYSIGSKGPTSNQKLKAIELLSLKSLLNSIPSFVRKFANSPKSALNRCTSFERKLFMGISERSISDGQTRLFSEISERNTRKTGSIIDCRSSLLSVCRGLWVRCCNNSVAMW